MVKMTTLDKPGHFIGADACRFFLHDHVGRFCVSTIGDYHPRSQPSAPWEPLGYFTAPGGDLTPARYETMVFDLRGKTARWTPVETHRALTEEAAQAVHAKALAEATAMARKAERAKRRAERAKETVVPPTARVGVRARRKTRGRDA